MQVDTPAGPGRLVVDAAADPIALLLLGHGAGGGVEAFDLAALAAALPAEGISVARFEQPWRTAGRRVAGPPKSLDAAWQIALEVVGERFGPLPLVVGGRSAGARVACRCFTPPALGVVALAFPLHPPGRPEKSRSDELGAVAGPVLVIQGERDTFGTYAEVRAAAPGRQVVEVPGATHGLGPTRRSDDPALRAQQVVAPVAAFVRDLARH
ncbi:hypothetical protein GA0111570_111111 [Raineyella antarctica]|uniref:KANL3/Tex30 alpha/beta hydrolase-like domain-containing protein n=1 Tax=Raineyella antarctica TaxID=1577474 RepID=A0A1G6HPD9_9ACTN|nr:alpha/beta family hydrolase [Raineyella antarctica]SDB95725.1 hypothetical protein GA0111570_111111 [Raineyella antarctica]